MRPLRILSLAAVLLILASAAAAFHYQRKSTALARELARLEKKAGPPESFRTELKPFRANPPPKDSPPEQEPTLSTADEQELLHRIAELERRLVEKEQQLAEGSAAAQGAPAALNQPDRSNWMDELQKTDPERYQEILQRREEAQKSMKDALAMKSSKLLAQDEESLDDAEREERAVMLSLMEETWRLAEMMTSDLPQEQRRELRGQMRDNMRQLNPLLESERQRQYFDLGKQLGYTDEEALGFVEYLVEVNDTTSMGDIWRFAGRGGGWGPPRGDQPPRDNSR